MVQFIATAQIENKAEVIIFHSISLCISEEIFPTIYGYDQLHLSV